MHASTVLGSGFVACVALLMHSEIDRVNQQRPCYSRCCDGLLCLLSTHAADMLQEEQSPPSKAEAAPPAEPAASRPKAAAKAAKGAAKAPPQVSPLEQLANAASWQAESERVQRTKASRKAAAAAVKQVLSVWHFLLAQMHTCWPVWWSIWSGVGLPELTDGLDGLK